MTTGLQHLRLAQYEEMRVRHAQELTDAHEAFATFCSNGVEWLKRVHELEEENLQLRSRLEERAL